MKLLDQIDGSDMYALPSDPMALEALSTFARNHLGYNGPTPRNYAERVNLWRSVNAELPVLKGLGEPGNDGAARLEKLLGINGVALAQTPSRADVTRVSNTTRSRARAACEALLSTGYTP